MRYWDPKRPRLNDDPTSWPLWLTARIVLPTLDFRPRSADNGFYTVRVMVGGSWAERNLTSPDLVLLLLYDWEADPEATLERWFKREPPGEAMASGAPPRPVAGTLDPEDLGI